MSRAHADEQHPLRLTPAVQWLLALNVGIAFLQITLVQPPVMAQLLGFQATNLWGQWWTTATYMFVHAGFWHLALNMYMLFLFGPRIEREWSPREFTGYYLLCGLGGLFAHLLFFRAGLLVGASAAVFGVTLAYALRWPDDELHLFGVIPLKVRWWIALLVLMDLWGGLSSDRTGIAHFAHLGGFATGLLYLRLAGSVRSRERMRPRVSQAPDYGDDPPRAIPRGVQRTRERPDEVDEIVAKSKAALAQRPSVQTLPAEPAPRPEPERELDDVLDKISHHGIESLTPAERRVLDDASRKMRGEEE